MARHKNIQLENLTKELVHSFLEAEVPPGIVNATSKNVTRIIANYKSLEVNNHAVKRMLDGIVLKMRVNGYQEKSIKLNKAAHKLLSSKALGEKGDLKWGLLSFILQLGKHPARSDFSDDSHHLDIEQSIPKEENMWQELQLSVSQYSDQDQESLSEWSEDDMKTSLIGSELNMDLENGDASINSACSNTTSGDDILDNWLTKRLENYWSDIQLSTPFPEYVIARECLWSLIYPASGIIFMQSSNGEFILGPFTASDISQESLTAILQPVVLALNTMKSINDWIEANNQVSFMSGILDSYAAGLLLWRNDLLKQLISIEKIVTNEEKSLVWLLHELAPFFTNISLIYRINREAFDDKQEGLASGLRLLSILIQTLGSSVGTEEKQIVFHLFMSAMKHHFHILQSWLGNQDLSSLHLEDFGITEKSLSRRRQNLEESYYSEDDAIEKICGLKFLVAVRPTLINIFDLNGIIKSIDADYLFADCIDNIEDLVRKKLKECMPYDTMSEAENFDDFSSDALTPKCVATVDSVSASSNSSLCEHTSTYPVVHMNNAFEDEDMTVKIVPNNTPKARKVPSYEVRGVECVLTDVLTTLVESHFEKVGKGFMSFLTHRYKSHDHVRVFKAVMLMEAGDLMREFYSYVFDKINNKESLEVFDLTARLQYCVDGRYSDYASNFSVVLGNDLDSVSKGESDWETTDLSSININYEVAWPISLIINEETVKLYNQLFAFCLNLKRSAAALENLHFKDLGRTSDCCKGSDQPSHDSSGQLLNVNERFHRLCLLRHWLLFFARTIHDHFNTSIIMPLSEKIDFLWKKDISPLQFLNEHVKALKYTCQQCFLNQENKSPIQIAISGAFSIIEDIRILWYGPPHKITDEKLVQLEDLYATCHRCLAHLLNFLSEKHSMPHVEALMDTLSASIPE